MSRKILLFLCLCPLIYPQILWEKTNFPDTICVKTMDFDESLCILYTGTQKYGLYKSTDNGIVWEKITENKQIYKVLVVSSDKVYTATSNGVFKTSDQGLNWKKLNITGTYFPTITSSPDGHLYLATSAGIFKSTDEGENWTKIFYGGSVYTILIDLQGNIYTASSNIVYKSVDYGLSWKRIHDLWNGPSCSSVYASAVTNENNILFSMWVGGVFFSSDGGSSFSQKNNGLDSFAVQDLMVDEGGRISALLPSGYFYSSDEADSWKYLGSGLGNNSPWTFTKDSEGYIYIGCYLGCIFRSKFSLSGLLIRERKKQLFCYPNSVATDSILISNKSDTLLTVSNIYSDNPVFNPHMLNFTLNPDDSIYFVFSYSPVQTGLDIANLLFHNSSIFDTIIVVLKGYTGIPYMQIPFHAVVFKEVQIGLSADTLISVKNIGVDTLIIDSVITTNPVFRCKIDENVILPGDSAAFKVTFQPTKLEPYTASLIIYSNNFSSPDTVRLVGFGVPFSTGYNDEIIEISSFELMQNYPNPFNPATTIKYQVPERVFVTVKIYDLLGNEVAKLVNKDHTAGSYEVIFDASSLVSGIYFYELRAGDFRNVKKLMLVK